VFVTRGLHTLIGAQLHRKALKLFLFAMISTTHQSFLENGGKPTSDGNIACVHTRIQINDRCFNAKVCKVP
jgi:hypothetical protein